MGEADVTRGLPTDLASVLRDQSVIVRQDAAVFELIAAWAKAPSATASADLVVGHDPALLDALCRQTHIASSNTPTRC
ncbi:MAG: hypothetical protein M3340_07340 [Actinomycetota bacterium]|nr:hypothetical protein [Actinomycetota bacterium]